MNISVRCKVRSEYSNFNPVEYNFNSSPVTFKHLIMFLKYLQVCDVFEMENVEIMISKMQIQFPAPVLKEKYITLYSFPSIFEFYIYTDPVRDQVLQISREDSLRAIFNIINSTSDAFNDPSAEEWFENLSLEKLEDDPEKPGWFPGHYMMYPSVSFKCHLQREFRDIIPKIIAESKQMEEPHVEQQSKT